MKREPKWIKYSQSPEDVTKRNLYSSDEGVMQQYLEDDDKSLNKVSLQYPTLFIESKNFPYRCNYSWTSQYPSLMAGNCLLLAGRNGKGKQSYLNKYQGRIKLS